jgi:hypothetical protein
MRSRDSSFAMAKRASSALEHRRVLLVQRRHLMSAGRDNSYHAKGEVC